MYFTLHRLAEFLMAVLIFGTFICLKNLQVFEVCELYAMSKTATSLFYIGADFWLVSFSFSSWHILFLRVAESKPERNVFREDAFFRAYERPIYSSVSYQIR